MKETILGYDQAWAVELGLDLTDLILLDYIKLKEQNEETTKKEIDGKVYVWVSYSAILEWLPILTDSKRTITRYVDRLVEKGLLEKALLRDEGCFTYFRLTEKAGGIDKKCERACTKSVKGYHKKCANKEIPRYIDTEIKEKEKDNNKLLSKKKNDVEDFETVYEAFMMKAVDDNEFKYSLRSYRIKDYTALLVSFRVHITNQCRQSEFIRNGYVRNRTWLLRSMPFLDLGEATGYSLGYGEFLKDNRRWYINRAGKEIEVPIDAPPRRQGTIWYKEQQRWGPDI